MWGKAIRIRNVLIAITSWLITILQEFNGNFFDNTFTEEEEEDEDEDEEDESTISMGDNFPGKFGVRPITT